MTHTETVTGRKYATRWRLMFYGGCIKKRKTHTKEVHTHKLENAYWLITLLWSKLPNQQTCYLGVIITRQHIQLSWEFLLSCFIVVVVIIIVITTFIIVVVVTIIIKIIIKIIIIKIIVIIVVVVVVVIVVVVVVIVIVTIIINNIFWLRLCMSSC